MLWLQPPMAMAVMTMNKNVFFIRYFKLVRNCSLFVFRDNAKINILFGSTKFFYAFLLFKGKLPSRIVESVGDSFIPNKKNGKIFCRLQKSI